MADVSIIHAADKGIAAARLADAIAAAGFASDFVEIGDPARLADALEGASADARILIWSRPLVSHALHSGELNRIRQLPGLIEVSADGIAPPSRGEDSRVVSISGWRGQPFHPGWQRIHLELKRLCGVRKGPSEAGPATAPRKPRPQRIAQPAPGAAAPVRSRRLLLGGGGALLLAAAAAGAAAWLGGGPSNAPPRRELPGATGPASVGQAQPTRPAVEPESAGAPAIAPPPVSSPAPPLAAQPSPMPEATSAGSRATPVTRPAPVKPAARSTRAARATARPLPRAEPTKKYSRKNSKVMRQFCERSGRSTPQCRTFLRSIGGARKAD